MDLIPALADCLPGRQVTDLEPLSKGWETDVYGFLADGESLVLRVYSGGDAWSRATIEAGALERLYAQGYPVPRLITFSEDRTRFGGSYLIMERIPGQVMWRHFGKATHEPPQVALFCSLLHRLHAVDPGAFGAEQPGGSFDLDFIAGALGGSTSAAFAPVLAVLRQWEPAVGRQRRSLIHGDFHLENILIRPDGTPIVIDWSGAALDDPRVDVAQSMVLAITNGSPEQAQRIRAGYEALSGPLPDLDFFLLLALTRRVLTVVATLVNGAGSVGLRPGLEDQLRQALPQIRQAVGLLEQMGGVALPDVHALLA